MSIGTTQDQVPDSPAVSGGNTFARRVARSWVARTAGKIRLLRGETIPATGATLLVINSAPNSRLAAAVAAAFERPVRCVIPEDERRGFGARWLAARLDMVTYRNDPSGRASAMAESGEALRRGEAVALFAMPEVARSEVLSHSCVELAQLVVQTESGRTGGQGTVLVPLHVLTSAPAGELLITAGEPLAAGAFLGGAGGDASTRTLAGELESRLAESPYHLQARDVRFFLADLEKILRADLEEDWAERPNWKQTTEGFELSRFLVEWAEQANVLAPERLIGLRIELEDYRERLRQWSLHRAEVEAAGEWIRSAAWRTLYWAETFLGLPVALYGLVNHLLPLTLVGPHGPLRRLAEKDPGHPWLLRALVLLGCYIVQVALCSGRWGRTAAGYYLLTLPWSGAFLWHYLRVIRTRARLLYLDRNLPRRARELRLLRKQFLEHLNAARDEYAQATLSSRTPD